MEGGFTHTSEGGRRTHTNGINPLNNILIDPPYSDLKQR